jgi:hypothetical protein
MTEAEQIALCREIKRRISEEEESAVFHAIGLL